MEPGGVVYSDFKGQPDQATFTPPSIDAAQYNAQAGWGEDELIFRRRLTIKVGARFDRLAGISSDAPAVDSAFNDTGTTIEGLGRLLTWTTVSPRVGMNFKLSEDGNTVLRAVVGRYYDPLNLTSVEAVHPGISVRTLTTKSDQGHSASTPRSGAGRSSVACSCSLLTEELDEHRDHRPIAGFFDRIRFHLLRRISAAAPRPHGREIPAKPDAPKP